MLLRCLLAESDELRADRTVRALSSRAVHVRRTRRSSELWVQTRRGGLDVVLASEELLGERAGEFLDATQASPLAPGVIFLSRSENADRRSELLALGALAVLNVDVHEELFTAALGAVLQRVEPVERLPVADETAYRPSLDDFRTRSPRMERFMDLVRRVSDSNSSILLQGETGVGKEWLARAVHGASRRSAEPFVAMNCAAFPETLLESELFGHEEGSFTGAIRSRRGRFELAHGGTIFLDEIGDMPLHMQAKLLRVLQEREITPLGSEEAIQVDVRLLAATNRNILELTQTGRFRSDLHYRLGVITLEIPPLRERPEDIPGLAQRYASELGMAQRGAPSTVDPSAIEVLVRHGWPGNVRELVNVVERAVLLSRGTRISEADLGLAIAVAVGPDVPPKGPGDPDDGRPTLKVVRQRAADAAEHAYLTGVLRQTSGRVGETARRIGVTPRALHARMRHLRLRKESFRSGPPPAEPDAALVGAAPGPQG